MPKELPIEINVTAEPGIDGKTPIKGVDYFTPDEQKAFVDEIMGRIRVPEDGKDAPPVDYSKVEAFITAEVAKIPKPETVEPIDTESIVAEVLKKIPEQPEIVVDYDALKKFCKEEIQKIEDSRESRVRQLHSGGPTTRLGEISDVEVEGVQTGQILTWNGTAWVPGNDATFTSPLTTKGDLYGFSTVDARIPVGTNGQVLQADSAQTLGVKYGVTLPVAGGAGVDMTIQVITSGTTFNALTPGLISFTQNSNVTINGITAPTGASGGITRIQNNSTGSTTVSISNQSGSATAANRIIPDLVGQSYVLSRGQGVELYYDTTVSRWRVQRYGVSAVSSPLTLSTRGLLAMSTAGPSQAGYVTHVDYSRWEEKMGASDPLNPSVAHSVPYFTDVDLTTPKKLDSGSELLYNPTLKMLGSGVPYADIAAKVHAQSGTVSTVADPDSSTCPVYQYQYTAPATPASVSIYQDYPDIARYTDNGSYAGNAGAGGYSVADVVDYIITPGYDDGSNPITWGVATGTITGITDGANTFDVYISINNATGQNFTTNVWSLSRQVNSGGYNDYQRFTTTTPTDTNSGWTAGADTLTNLADDFLANGTDYTGIIQFYETDLSPDSVQTIVSSVYDPAFIDDNSGNAYKMYVSNATAQSWYGVRVSWVGTRNFTVAPNSSYVGYFTSGPIGVTSSGAPTTTPTTWGYLSNGTNLTNTFDYYSSATTAGVTYYSANSYQTVFTDPNDGNYYYYSIGSATISGKMKKDSLYKVFAQYDFLYDGDASVYPDNSTVTPKSFAYPADRTDTKGTTTAELVGILHHALDSSGRIYHSWTDSSNAEIASLRVDSTGMTYSSPVNITSSLQCDSIVNDTGLAHGTYTPTLTGVTNVSSSTAYACQYMRVGNTVTVSGKVEVTPTANNTRTTIRISLPIASALANDYELGGTAHTNSNANAGHGASIEADATNDEALMDYYETHGASENFFFTFTYQII